MKSNLLTATLMLLISLQLVAQTNPLVGTWQAVSFIGTDADGKKLTYDDSQFVETKIITPTHYALFTQMKQGDSLVFDKAMTGIVTVEGNKYIETPMYISQQQKGGAASFTYKLEGDKFMQSGSGTNAEGKKVSYVITFQKVKAPAQKNPAIGTWNQLSSKGASASGEKWQHDNTTHTRLLVVNPTHFMIIAHDNKQFENAIVGSYKMQGNKMVIDTYTHSKYPGTAQVELTPRLEGAKMTVDAKATLKDGKVDTWTDVYEKVNEKTSKTASTK